jgi:hypothetical protein
LIRNAKVRSCPLLARLMHWLGQTNRDHEMNAKAKVLIEYPAGSQPAIPEEVDERTS